jgi:hypothetical protein
MAATLFVEKSSKTAERRDIPTLSPAKDRGPAVFRGGSIVPVILRLGFGELIDGNS